MTEIFQNKTYESKISIMNFCIEDERENTRFKNILKNCLEASNINEKMVEFHLQKFDQLVMNNDTSELKLNASVTLLINSILFIYVDQFIKEITLFFNEISEIKQVF